MLFVTPKVRIDNEAVLRVGDPYDCKTETCIRPASEYMEYPGSIMLNATQQSIKGDSELRPLLLKGALGIEIGSLDGGLRTGGRLSRLDRLKDTALVGTASAIAAEDDTSKFPGGRPLIVMRDIEIDGCSVPCTETDGVCYTADAFDEDTELIYRTRDSTTLGTTGAYIPPLRCLSQCVKRNDYVRLRVYFVPRLVRLLTLHTPRRGWLRSSSAVRHLPLTILGLSGTLHLRGLQYVCAVSPVSWLAVLQMYPLLSSPLFLTLSSPLQAWSV
jgi:hypothetical protein